MYAKAHAMRRAFSGTSKIDYQWNFSFPRQLSTFTPNNTSELQDIEQTFYKIYYNITILFCYSFILFNFALTLQSTVLLLNKS